MAEGQQHGAEDYDDPDFDERGPVLQVGALARAPDVDGGDHGDHGDGNERGFERRERNDFGEIAGEGASERCDGTAGDYEKKAPTVEEGRHAAEGIANENIEAAGFGIGRG